MMGRFLCWLGVHRMAKWSAPQMYNAERTYNALVPTLTTTVEVTVTLQERSCERCGRAQKREV